jgi:ABC-type nitrate/sulfonate/bicarbonate transport system permease component
MAQPGTETATGRLGSGLSIGRRRTKETILAVSILALWLLIWEFSMRGGLLDDRFFRAPAALWATLVALAGSGELWKHLGVSVQRLIGGYLMGLLPALLLAKVIDKDKWPLTGIRVLVGISGLFPAMALFPLLLLIFWLGEPSRCIVVALGVFFPVLLCARTIVALSRHVQQIEPIKASGGPGRVLEIGRLRLSFLAPKLGIGIALLTLVSAEFVGAKTGIGYLIWQSWQTFSVETMYVAILVTGALGLLAWLAVDLVERLVLAVAARRGVT